MIESKREREKSGESLDEAHIARPQVNVFCFQGMASEFPSILSSQTSYRNIAHLSEENFQQQKPH